MTMREKDIWMFAVAMISYMHYIRVENSAKGIRLMGGR